MYRHGCWAEWLKVETVQWKKMVKGNSFHKYFFGKLHGFLSYSSQPTDQKKFPSWSQCCLKGSSFSKITQSLKSFKMSFNCFEAYHEKSSLLTLESQTKFRYQQWSLLKIQDFWRLRSLNFKQKLFMKLSLHVSW